MTTAQGKGTAEAPKAPKIAKQRSPQYPAISLGDALTLTGKLFEAANRTAIAPTIAVKAMGYHGLDGYGRRNCRPVSRGFK